MSEEWWITTGPLPEGEKILGPFGSQDLAIKVRGYMDPSGGARYWVDSDE